MSEKLASWRELRPYVSAIYDHSSAGCCWHIVLDDGNLDDDDVDFCIKRAESSKNCVTGGACRAIGPLMRQASKTQRRRLYKGDL